MRRINALFGQDVSRYDSYRLVRKEIAALAGLGRIGRNSLFFSRRFGFNCKIDLFLTDVAFDEERPLSDASWQLALCRTCNVCVDACPVSAYDNFVMTDVVACDNHITPKWETPSEMCRSCITSCPGSETLLQRLYRDGVPAERCMERLVEGDADSGAE
jgi:epoxyqueuosine reductase QueG